LWEGVTDEIDVSGKGVLVAVEGISYEGGG